MDGRIRVAWAEDDEDGGTERGCLWVTGVCPLGNTLCQHVPETAATQGRPAASQAGVRAVVPPPVLHHIH